MALTQTIVLFVLVGSLAHADRVAASGTHLRGKTPAARALIKEGMRESLSFRTSVERLNLSDVVVYVTEDPLHPHRLAGRLTFLSKAGNYRYVIVRLAWRTSPWRQIATLGHEIEHALEIAQRPNIV